MFLSGSGAVCYENDTGHTVREKPSGKCGVHPSCAQKTQYAKPNFGSYEPTPIGLYFKLLIRNTSVWTNLLIILINQT